MSAGVLDPQGPIAGAERLLLLNAAAIMSVVVVPVIIMTLTFAWWFRASNPRAQRRPDWAYSGSVELVVWAIPTMIVILLAGVAWISTHELDPRAPLRQPGPPLRIDVVSLDWNWLFLYPELQLATVNQLFIPSGVPVEFHLTSATVMTAFFVPQLGSQIYAMPGMTTHLNLLADHPGDYPGLASHFSGDGFSDMHFDVHAVSPPAFREWVDRTRREGPLDSTAYENLARRGSKPGIRAYGQVPPGLFDHVIDGAASMAGTEAHPWVN